MSVTDTSQHLGENDIHIWMVKPEQITASTKLSAIVSPLEQQKISRYRSDKAKHTALITRSFIRLLLSKYENIAPQAWKFEISELGKPEVSNASTPLRFNLSHNNEIIICAICLNKDIGCDIENLSRKISVDAIAKRFFSPSEHVLISKDNERFFEYWTLKEAFVKATGLGISQGLDTFSFEIKAKDDHKNNDNISLTFNENCKEKDPQNWYHSLHFPDQKHCIGLSVNNRKQTELKPNIRLFSAQDGLNLFSHLV